MNTREKYCKWQRKHYLELKVRNTKESYTGWGKPWALHDRSRCRGKTITGGGPLTINGGRRTAMNSQRHQQHFVRDTKTWEEQELWKKNNEKINKQVLQKEAYPAMWRPVDAQNSAIPEATPPQIGEDLSEIRSNGHEKFHADRQSPDWEICNRTYKNGKRRSKLSIPPYTTYGEIKSD